jgi:hypothetical protein
MVYRPKAEESVSAAVVRSLADAEGVDPVDLDECLYDHVDPDALDKLFQGREGSLLSRRARVSFTISDYRVEIEGTQKIVLTRQFDGHPAAEETSS